MAPQKRPRDLVDQAAPSTSLLRVERAKKAKRSHEPGSYDAQAAPTGKKVKFGADGSSKDVTKRPSTIVAEEVDFPRGGGVSLEELNRGGGTTPMEVDGSDSPQKSKRVSEAKKKKGKQEVGAPASSKSDTIRVEHLNYKRLEPGQKLLGQITSILPLALIISLPNQLMGHVPIVNISSQLTSRLEAAPSNTSEPEHDEHDEESDSVPSLSHIFTPGQYISCIVKQVRPASSTIDFGAKPRDEEEKAARRVELSIRPNEINVGIGSGDLCVGFNITGAIRSIEDHGYVVDLGLADVSGFIPYKDKPDSGAKRLTIGQVVSSTVVKMSENKRLCTLSTRPEKLRSALLSEATSPRALLPGSLVSALVTAIVPSGLNVQILGYFAGTVELFHLPGSSTNIKIGDRIKARVLWDIPGSSPPRFALSLLLHVLQLTAATIQPAGPITKGSKKSKKQAIDATPPIPDAPTLREAYPMGMILDVVRVTRVESEWGLVCEVADNVGGFVHISQVSDSLVPQLSSASGTWRVGSTHRARVTGYHALDGLLLLSLKPSIFELEYMQVADVTVGKILKGTIVRLRESGLVVALSDKVNGLVTPLHYSDIKLKHPERKFKEGATTKCRVLSVNPDRSRVLLTLKKSLLESTLPILATFDDARVGMVTTGVIQRIEDRFVIVEYYGGVRALVPLNELTDIQISSTADLFVIGQVVKSRITAVDREQHRLTASIRQAAPSFQTPVDISSVEIGSTVAGTVTAIHDENVVLSLKDPDGGRALLSVSNLANAHGTTVPQLRSSLEHGERIEGLSVISVNPEKALVIVSAAKPKPKSKSKSITSSLRIDALEEGQVVSGRITRTMGTGIGVRLSNSVVGRLHSTDLADDYTGPLVTPPAEGSIVNVVIIRVDKNLKRVDVSMRRSRLEPEAGHKVVDREIQVIEELRVGEKVKGFVKSVAQHGLFIMVGRDLDARVQIKELFDDYVKDWQSRFTVGQVVETRVLSTNPNTNQVELTMRSGDINKLLRRTLGLADFEVKQKIEGRVKSVTDFGIFIEIAGTKISGLCHKSEISDNKKANVSEALKSFREGDPVKAVILSIDVSNRKISFGIKPSYFSDDDLVMKAAPNVEEGSESEGSVGDDGAQDDDEEEGSDEDSDDAISQVQVALLEETPAHSSLSIISNHVPALPLSGGFSWSSQNEGAVEAGASESEISDSEDEESRSKKRKKRKILQDLTADLHTKVPESTADFERVVLGSPNSSYLWIQYMSFQLQLSEVDKAREIGRRALQTINYREEQEKLNVWIALLNLENQFGTEESLETLFKDAARHNDSKTVHLKLASIFEESEKTQKAEEQFARTAKKFSQSSKAWTLFGEYYLKAGKLEDARKLLARSLLSLPQRKHLKTISIFARMEYKLGDPERGKTIFEGIVESHPKRNDLWSMYIDMEASQNNVQSIRNIFNRALARKLSSKQAKFFFKKWLELERRIGDESGAEAVMAKAVAWTQAHSGSSDQV
ncbi:RRNA biogenesis protein RRP5 [Ceratobasidium theobromae]|uniref:rRNA biogenesis protein RRP5 n=1 Tax=Ceratobasidium theobromae TaxID=1582974 RepID=A0A5N5Q8K0_9AGAM|nr:RRNA biogenesis protein RRP5 [Ceratobasidium theobromae]